jgi:ubiquinone/menaquinone biosynthesis C-methylase UbiE
MEMVLCNYCKSAKSDILYSLPDLFLGKNDVMYTLVKCRNCGLIYQNPRPTQDEIATAYPTTYESFNFDQNETWFQSRILQYGLEKRSKTITTLKRNQGRLLDIGCSTGLFLHTMETKYGWKTHGVELSEYSSRIAIEKYHLNVFQGTLEQASYASNYFDAVTLWDVLEHLPDPSSTLHEIKRILKTDGILVLRVPNSDSCDAKIFRSAWAGLDVPRHFYIFSQRSLQRILEKNGFRIYKKTFNIGSFPMFILSLRFWMNKHNLDSSHQILISKLINNPLSQVIFAPYFLICELFFHGSAITITAFTKND